jgi:L-histidine Nalpha-methyltransferase
MRQSLARTYEPAFDSEFQRDVVRGLSEKQKNLPCKYFYDANGDALFEQITRLDEYYLARTEIAIMRQHLPDMARWIGPRARIAEFGAGAGIKTELLLDALEKPAAYIPIDISASSLASCVRHLARQFPELPIKPVHADYMDDELFTRLSNYHSVTVFFPGSTLGNLETTQAHAFLTRMKRLIGKEGGLLIGIDLMKDERMLLSAYDDREGVTSAFNKNLLARINHELGGNFDLDAFSHRAVVNHREQRVEMYLVSERDQVVRIGDQAFAFTKGETIHTENAHKYTLASFHTLAEVAGLTICQSWMDRDRCYSMHYLKAV